MKGATVLVVLLTGMAGSARAQMQQNQVFVDPGTWAVAEDGAVRSDPGSADETSGQAHADVNRHNAAESH